MDRNDRYDYISLIIKVLRGTTGMNFQKLVGKVLKEYNKYMGKTYEMPDAYGGDKKNDGWVVEDALFYQIFAPARYNDSLKKNMQKKFSEDLEGLLEKVYKEKLWNGNVKEFVFLVNTFDNNLPEDSERYYEKEVKRLQSQYNISFQYKVDNLSYIEDILGEIEDVKVLERISARIQVINLIDYNAVSEEVMMDLIKKISNKLNKRYLDTQMNKELLTDYNRISSVKKISINHLDEYRQEIETIISNLDVVENTVKTINQDLLFENKFERVKAFVVNKYTELSQEVVGVELYKKLIDEIFKCVGYDKENDDDDTSIKFLIVYIFDKCDIFEKE